MVTTTIEALAPLGAMVGNASIPGPQEPRAVDGVNVAFPGMASDNKSRVWPSMDSAIDLDPLPRPLSSPIVKACVESDCRSPIRVHDPFGIGSTGATSGSSSAEGRIADAVHAAFERLWNSQAEASVAKVIASGCDDISDESWSSPQTNSSVDAYISQYFRHVAELSRESVYQAHQRDILQRMREELVLGDRSGSMKELDEMIQRVDVDDRTLKAEIAKLMRITEASDVRKLSSLQLASCCCSSDEDSHRARTAVALNSVARGDSSVASGGKEIPPCTSCSIQ